LFALPDMLNCLVTFFKSKGRVNYVVEAHLCSRYCGAKIFQIVLRATIDASVMLCQSATEP
jgi:hypothetical protein